MTTFNEEDIKDMKEVMEPENWTSIDLYYKGVHVKKSISKSMKAEELIKTIDAYLDAGFLPSWNAETNGKVGQLPTPPVTKPCTHEGCQGTMTFKKGTSTKTGKPWSGWFCDIVKEHVNWEK